MIVMCGNTSPVSITIFAQEVHMLNASVNLASEVKVYF